jgi:hypothetical protein
MTLVGKAEIFREQTVPVPFCPLHLSHEMAAVSGRRLTA